MGFPINRDFAALNVGWAKVRCGGFATVARSEGLGKMGSERIFVGRQGELERFGEVLAELRGQAVVVVGNRGMGKTWLVDEMAERMEKQPPFWPDTLIPLKY